MATTRLFTRSPLLLSRPQRALARTISSLSRSAVASRSTASSAPRSFSTQPTLSSLRDGVPNWSSRHPPQETGGLKRWLVFMEKPVRDPTRDEIINICIKTLSKIVGSEDAARIAMYVLSASDEEARRFFFAFGALLSEEDALRLKRLEGVRWVLPDHGVKKKKDDDGGDGGEPCSSRLAVPTYHEESIRSDAHVNERIRTYYDDISSNSERRREKMQNINSNFQNGAPPNQGGPQPPTNQGGPPSSSSARTSLAQFKLELHSRPCSSMLEDPTYHEESIRSCNVHVNERIRTCHDDIWSNSERWMEKMQNINSNFQNAAPPNQGGVGEIIKTFEQKGFLLRAGMKLVNVEHPFAEKHYEDLSSKPFFEGLVEYIISGPVVAMVWEGKNVVATGRKIIVT